MSKASVHIILIRKSAVIAFFSVFVLLFLLASFVVKRNDTRSAFISTNSPAYKTVMKRDMLCLMSAYWQYVRGVQQMSDGNVYLVMQSGARILYDDKKVKTSDEKFYNSDLQDMLEQIYPLYGDNYLRSIDFNPGEDRVYQFFKDIYGQDKQKVESSLISVGFGDKVLQFNYRNNAANALKEVDAELYALARTRSDLIPFIYPSSGTYNYRYIAETNLLSEHSFGIAIDLASNRSDYHLWVSRLEGQKRMSVYPPEVVRIFEKNNFIWGGRWGYFDLMHYEYRPEVILKAKYFSKLPGNGQPWYTGAPYSTDVHIRNYVRMIDAAIK